MCSALYEANFVKVVFSSIKIPNEPRLSRWRWNAAWRRHNLISGGTHVLIRNQNPACTEEPAPGDKDQSVGAAYFSPAEQRSHCHPGSFGLSIFCSHPVLSSSLCLQLGTIGNKPGFHEPPKSNQELAGQSHDCNAPDPAGTGSSPFPEPL